MGSLSNSAGLSVHSKTGLPRSRPLQIERCVGAAGGCYFPLYLLFIMTQSNSRLIVKNIPAHLNEKQLKEKFQKFGAVTDCQIRMRGAKSRRFAFIGFRQNSAAKSALQYLNDSYLKTSKIKVQFAKLKDQTISKQAPVVQQQAKKRSQNFQIAKELILNKSKRAWQDVLQANQALQDQTQSIPLSTLVTPVQPKRMTKTQERLLARDKKNLKVNEKLLRFVNKPLQLNSCRLYVTNIPYQSNEQEIRNLFQPYGFIKSLKVPKQGDKIKGIAFVQFQDQAQAMLAFNQTNNKVKLGRILHVEPAMQDLGKVISHNKQQFFQKHVISKMSQDQKSSYKKKKQSDLQARLQDQSSWNTLFLNPNTVVQYLARASGLQKGQVLDPTTQGLAVKITLAQADIISETKSWLVQQGLSLQFLQKSRKECKRSATTILVKNLPFTSSVSKLRQQFSYFGAVRSVLQPQNRAIAIIQFKNEQHAANAFKALSYKKWLGSVLYLQWAPQGLVSEQQKAIQKQKQVEQIKLKEQLSKVLYVKNLNFSTGQQQLQTHFKDYIPASVKIVKNKDNLSMGYAFVNFKDQKSCLQAIKNKQNSLLDGHMLQLSISRPKQEVKVKQQKAKIQQEPTPKLVVRNLPFQANKSQIKQLFKSHGQVKSVRLPVKGDGTHRGFCFIQFSSANQAGNAKQMLEGSHLYGRKLVIQFAQNKNVQSLV